MREYNLGKSQTQETINKRKNTIIEKKKQGWKQTNISHKKKVICIERNQIFESVKDVAKFLSVDASNISRVLKGRQKTCKGYHFKYVV